MDEKTTISIDRPLAMDKGQLIAHLKTVGQRIIDDAEAFGADPKHTSEIRIFVSISPNDSTTSIDYDIIKVADPRLK